MIDLRSAARALGGEVSGRSILAPAPGHPPADRGMSVTPSLGSPDGILVHLFNGTRADALAAKDHVRQRLGLYHDPMRLPPRREPAGYAQSQDLRSRHAEPNGSALRIWREAGPGPLPERYLARRGVAQVIPTGAFSDVLRWHPRCPFGSARTGAMVALVRNVLTNAPQSIHRTALDPDGNKIAVDGRDRMALGPIAVGAVKLAANEDVTTCLGVAEGIETALSLRLVPEFGLSPVWALISAGGVASFPVLPGIECLWIAVDHDDAGRRSARECAERWRAAGREVFLITPRRVKADLNDLAREAAHV